MNQINTNLIYTYLFELRRRALFCFATIAVFFAILSLRANELYHLLALPLTRHLTPNEHVIATSLATTWTTPMKLVFYMSIFLSIPVLLYHLWKFIAPALHHFERHILWSLLISSTLLFYLGVLFGYFILLPLSTQFLITTAPSDVWVMPEMNNYLENSVSLMLLLGIVFEIPLFMATATRYHLVNAKTWPEKRPYFILGAFIVSGFIAPPDLLSQCLFALPLCVLFEAGVLLSKRITGVTKQPFPHERRWPKAG